MIVFCEYVYVCMYVRILFSTFAFCVVENSGRSCLHSSLVAGKSNTDEMWYFQKRPSNILVNNFIRI